VFLENTELFENHSDGEYLSLVVFMIYEMIKGISYKRIGDKSLWKPYFDTLPPADLLALWSDSELDELHDPELIQEALRYRKNIDKEWIEVKAVLKKYPNIFPLDKINKEMFVFVYGNVVTRCFGWSLPCTMMTPFADAANHCAIDGDNELFDLALHKKAIINSTEDKHIQMYATKDKMKLDYSDIMKEGSKEMSKVIKPFVISEDVLEICTDVNNFKETEHDIWEV